MCAFEGADNERVDLHNLKIVQISGQIAFYFLATFRFNWVNIKTKICRIYMHIFNQILGVENNIIQKITLYPAE